MKIKWGEWEWGKEKEGGRQLEVLGVFCLEMQTSEELLHFLDDAWCKKNIKYLKIGMIWPL